MTPTETVFNYTPRAQFVDFHNRTTRFACMVCHRRAGKTVACVNELVLRALYTRKKDARYQYISPTYTQSKDIAWTYLKSATAPFASEIRESELRVKLPNGAWITLYGADNPDRLRGLYSDGCIIDEAGDCRPNLLGEIIMPLLMDRTGWLVVIGTPRGKNHFYRLYQRSQTEPNWYSKTLRADTSGILTPKQIESVRQEIDEAEFEQEMNCSFTAALRGTFYAHILNGLEKAGQIGTVEREVDRTVNVAFDIGRKDSTAAWFWQSRPEGISLIDYHETAGSGPDYWFDLLEKKPYSYQSIYLPHDAKAKTFATKRSTLEQFIDWARPLEDTRVQLVPRMDRQHGIDAVRKILPYCHFNRSTCFDGIEALRAYRRKFDPVKNVYANEPLHDWASDGADAFRYLALMAEIDGQSLVPAQTPAEKREQAIRQIENAATSPEPYTLEQLFKAREKSKYAFQKLRIG